MLAAATAACAGPGAALRPVPARTVEVALVGLFSGPGGAVGQDLRNSLELQARAIDDAGGVLGARVEIVAADAAADPARAAELVREQVGGTGVRLVVGPDTTAGFVAARPALDQAGVPNCLTNVADGALRGSPTTFLVGPSNGVEVSGLLASLRRVRPDVHRVGLLDAGDELGGSYDALLAALAPDAGLSYAGRAAAGADAGAALEQLAAQGAKAVVLALPPAAAARAAAAAAQLGAGRPLLTGFAAIADYGFPSQGGDAAVGALVVATPQAYLTAAPRARWPAGYRAFVSTAVQQYGFGADGVQPRAAPAGADCLLQWSRAVQAAGTSAGRAVARAWERLDLPAAETALGVRERPTPANHSTVGPDGLAAYTWARAAGGRYQLQQQ